MPDIPIEFERSDVLLPLGQPGVTTPAESFAEAMDVYWRVKFWALNTEGNAQISANDLGHNAFDEKQLILPTNEADADGEMGKFFYADWAIEGNVPAQENTARVFLLGGQQNLFNPLMFDGSLYYMAWYGASPSGAPWTQEFSYTVARLDRLVYQLSGLLIGNGEDGIGSYPFTLTLRPSEWWEYDPGDGGGPIYDKDTGKQLRPFP